MSNPSRPSSSPSVATPKCEFVINVPIGARCGADATETRPILGNLLRLCPAHAQQYDRDFRPPSIPDYSSLVAPSSSERAPTSTEIAARIAELEKSCRCLYIAVDRVIADVEGLRERIAVIADSRSVLASSPVVPEPHVEPSLDEVSRLVDLWCTHARNTFLALRAARSSSPVTPTATSEDTARLLRFAGHALTDVRLREIGEWDGGAVQDALESAGLIERTRRVVPCGDDCRCAEYCDSGETAECYPITPLGRASISAYRAWQDAARSTPTGPQAND